MADLGRWLILSGLGIVALGLLVALLGRLPFMGHLPGDVLLRGGWGSVYFPIVTCLILSVVLTVALNVVIALLRH